MRKQIIALFLILALLFIVAGCAPKAPEAEISASSAQELETGIGEILTVEQELNTSELDTLDADIAAIEGLDI